MYLVVDMAGYKHFLTPGFNVISIEEGLIAEKKEKQKALEDEIACIKNNILDFKRWQAGEEVPQWQITKYKWNTIPNYEEKRRQDIERLEVNLATLNALRLPKWQIQVILHNEVIDIDVCTLPVWIGTDLRLHN